MTDTATTITLEKAARAVLVAADHNRDALNGLGHPGEPHDDVLAPGGHDIGGGVTVRDTVGDCARCGGAQYGSDDELLGAYGDLRAALGDARLPWEPVR